MYLSTPVFHFLAFLISNIVCFYFYWASLQAWIPLSLCVSRLLNLTFRVRPRQQNKPIYFVVCVCQCEGYECVFLPRKWIRDVWREKGWYLNMNITCGALGLGPSSSGHWAGNSSPCDQRPSSQQASLPTLLPFPLIFPALPSSHCSNQSPKQPGVSYNPVELLHIIPGFLQILLVPPDW